MMYIVHKNQNTGKWEVEACLENLNKIGVTVECHNIAETGEVIGMIESIDAAEISDTLVLADKFKEAV